jgi:hypothetical protein
MSPTRRSFLTGAAALAAPLSIPAIGLATRPPAGDGIALIADSDDTPFTEYDHTGALVTHTWRELDGEAFDALDRITGATFHVAFKTASGWFGLLEFKLRAGQPMAWWAPCQHTRPIESSREATLQSLPKWMWRQIGHEVLEIETHR